jgi:hypothetical protein
MVKFHLPFATLEETNFRMISMYLFAQYFKWKDGIDPDWSLNNFSRIYEDIRVVNKNFCDKLRERDIEDAAINALVGLDCFAFSISYVIDSDKLKNLGNLFRIFE